MKEQLKKLISKGKTRQVIAALLEATKEDDHLNRSVIMLSGRYERITRQKDLGTLGNDEYEVQISRINQGIFSLFDDLDDKSTAQFAQAISSQGGGMTSSKVWQKVVAASVIIGIIAGLFKIAGVNLSDLFGTKTPDSFSVTVLVHGKGGKDDPILKNQGKVILDIGDDRKTEKIVDNEATFKTLPAGYIDKMALISIEHNQPYFPTERNKEYKLEKDQSIYLEVELKGIDKIKGRITDEATGDPLDSVRVSVENIAVYTDEFGWYELTIPAEKQAKTVSVTFMKAGYQTENVGNYAPHTKQELTFPLKKQ